MLAPGEAGTITVTLELPPGAADGYYEGRLKIVGSVVLSVPMAFTLLSRVTVRVLDEQGQEIVGWGHMAVLARVPDADFLISNVPLQIPATFTVPSGGYHAQAFGRVGLYDHLLIPGLEQQVPYALIEPATILPHTSQTITLSLADTRTYWLPATDVDGNPVFVNAWAESFRYRCGDATWLTRLGQSNIRVLSTDLPGDWPDGFLLRLSDTPADVSFDLSLQGAGFTDQYRDFVKRHSTRWPADRVGNMGFPLTGSADRIELLAWERDSLDAGTPITFTVTAGEVGRYIVRTDLPGKLDPPWVGWETSAEGWWYPPTGGSSILEPVAAGLTRAWTVAGAQHSSFWAGSLSRYRRFQRAFYTPDWTQSTPWGEDEDVVVPDESALLPLPPAEGAFVVGAGPIFPAVTFDNRPGTIQMRYPLLAGADGSPVIWGSDKPAYSLTRSGAGVDGGTLEEAGLLPFPMRRWLGLAAGSYQMAITPTLDGSGIGPSIVRAGFTLGDEATDDLDPPQVLGLALPQRFEAGAAMTATWSLSDANPVTLSASVQLGDGAWEPLGVVPLGEGRFSARIEPATAPTVTLAYTATDVAGNWIAWQPGGGASALAEVPVTLSFEMEPASVPWTSRPVTVRLKGSLLGGDGLPLSETPAWIRLEAGGRLAGYVRDLTGTVGTYQTGTIDFSWTFVPADLTGGPGTLPVEMSFDLGIYAPQAVTRTLHVVPPLYLPLVGKGGAR